MIFTPVAVACAFTSPLVCFIFVASIPVKFAPLPTKLVAVTTPTTDTPVPTNDEAVTIPDAFT